jgi:RHS repeat-associated protein
VRQLTDAGGVVSLAKGYDPFGNANWSAGSAQTPFGYTGEQTDANGLVYLRARYYSTTQGRFLTRDKWLVIINRPMSINKWIYAYESPLRYVDPSGYIAEGQEDQDASEIVNRLEVKYNVRILKDWGYRPIQNLSLLPSVIPSNLALGCYWETGNWRSKQELSLIEETVKDVAIKLGGEDKFISAMRNVDINRAESGPAWSPPPPILSNLLGDIVLPDELFDESKGWFKYTLTHELGHKWDYEDNYNLSQGLMKKLGTWICNTSGNNCKWYPFAHHIDPNTLESSWEMPAGVNNGCTGLPPYDSNCPEAYALTWGAGGLEPQRTIVALFEWGPGLDDWAESFANIVYPLYYLSIRRSGLVRGGIREKYVNEKIHSIP